jgi:thioredoxin-like negative regulator of GroEL
LSQQLSAVVYSEREGLKRTRGVRFMCLYPKLMKIARDEFPQARFLKVNIDEHEELSRTLGVDRLPTFMVFKGGASQDTFTASMSAKGLKTLRSTIQRHYSS